MRYLSLFSGIEAASCAWKELDWSCVGVSEIDPFASAVLAHHYADVPNLGDITQITKEQLDALGAIDLVVGGSPCQSFSYAGLRKGLDDPRGNLMLEYIRIVNTIRPQWFIWENVPGVLSSGNGRDFGTLVRSMVELGYSCCWRVLDAKFFGVPQRRRRVFLVGHIDSKTSPFEVLFEQNSSGRDYETSCQPKQEDTPQAENSIRKHAQVIHHLDFDVAGTLNARDSKGVNADDTEYGQKLVPETAVYRSSSLRIGGTVEHTICPTVLANWEKLGDTVPLLPVLESNQANLQISWNISPTLPAAMGNGGGYVPMIPAQNLKVRRLTPLECERLQGFPDNYTRISWRNKKEENCPIGHRYRCLGNSMAVPVMKWLGKQIEATHDKITS